MRLTRVSPPIVPGRLDEVHRLAAARAVEVRRRRRLRPASRRSPSPAIAASRLLLLRLELRHIGRAEIDRVEQQRREAGVLDRVGDDLAGEREQQARRLDQQERRQRFFREVAQSEQAGVAQVDQEMDAAVGSRATLRS